VKKKGAKRKKEKPLDKKIKRPKEGNSKFFFRWFFARAIDWIFCWWATRQL